MPTKLKVKHIADTDIHNAEEPLVTPLELALIKDLDRNDRGFGDGAVRRR